MAKNLRAILPVGLTALGKHDHLRDTRRGKDRSAFIMKITIETDDKQTVTIERKGTYRCMITSRYSRVRW